MGSKGTYQEAQRIMMRQNTRLILRNTVILFIGTIENIGVRHVATPGITPEKDFGYYDCGFLCPFLIKDNK
jgi:hypothetical protein